MWEDCKRILKTVSYQKQCKYTVLGAEGGELLVSFSHAKGLISAGKVKLGEDLGLAKVVDDFVTGLCQPTICVNVQL